MPQLHDDPDFWAPRHCFREPVPEIFTAADLLSRAVDVHLKGHHAQASSLIAQANMPDIRDWYQPIMGKESPEIHRERQVPDTPDERPKDKRDSKRHPSAEMKDALIARDGYRCRFCGIPTIRRRIRDRLCHGYPQALPWPTRGHGCDQKKHAAFMCMTLTYDHVHPHSRGGPTSIDNLVVTCWPCNFGRQGRTLEQLGLINPFDRVPVQIDWDGLERLRSAVSHPTTS